jgi:ethanolamine transporter EutH
MIIEILIGGTIGGIIACSFGVMLSKWKKEMDNDLKQEKEECKDYSKDA